MEIELSTEIYLSHEREIKRFLFKCTQCENTADDIAAKLNSVTNLADIDNIRAYLYRMASNLVIERMRTEARQNRLPEKHTEAMLPMQDSRTPEDWLAAKQQLCLYGLEDH